MEKVKTDEDDRPKQEIKITGATVFVNPYKDEEEAERKAAEESRLKVCTSHHLMQVHMMLNSMEQLGGLQRRPGFSPGEQGTGSCTVAEYPPRDQ